MAYGFSDKSVEEVSDFLGDRVYAGDKPVKISVNRVRVGEKK